MKRWRAISPLLLTPAFVAAMGCGASGGAGGGAPQGPSPVATGQMYATPPGRACELEGLPGTYYSAQDPSIGSDNAPLTAVMFGDLECEPCRQAEASLLRLQQRLGPDRLRIVWKHAPLERHHFGRRAANVGAAVFLKAGSTAFFDYSQRVYALGGRGSEEDLHRAAKAATGLGRSEFMALLIGGATKRKVAKDRLLAQQLGLRSSPVVMINGRRILGARTEGQYAAVFDKFRKQAQNFRASLPASTNVGCRLAATNYREKPLASPATTETRYPIAIGRSPSIGPANTGVTVVAFSGYQCKYCKKANEALATVAEKYHGRVRIVWKEAPQGDDPYAWKLSMLSHALFRHRGNNAFWQGHEELVRMGRVKDQRGLWRAAEALGFSHRRTRHEWARFSNRGAVEADLRQALKGGAATRLPAFFVNGRRLLGVQPARVLMGLIDEELTRAAANQGRGSSYYRYLTKGRRAADLPYRRVSQPPPGRYPQLGQPNSSLRIQVYAMVPCGQCARLTHDLERLGREYRGNIFVEWRGVQPEGLGPQQVATRKAVEHAWEVFQERGDSAFWSYFHAISHHQWDRGAMSEPWFARHARHSGANPIQFAQAARERRHRKIGAQATKQAQARGVRKNPTVIINNRLVEGNISFPVLQAVAKESMSNYTL